MTQTADFVSSKFDWPQDISKRSLERQHDAFSPEKKPRRAFLTPRVTPERMWLGDASLLHDLGWWWLMTLRAMRTAVSMGFETIDDLIVGMEIFDDVAEEAYAPIESMMVDDYQLFLFIDHFYKSMTPGERAFTAVRSLSEIIRKLEHDLTTYAMVDLRNIHTEADEHLRNGTFTQTANVEIVEKIARNSLSLLTLLEKERSRAEQLRRFAPEEPDRDPRREGSSGQDASE